MPNLTVALISPPEYAKDLGKKGTESDITFYNLKRDDVTVTLIEPSRYPERLSSLFFAISMAGKAILVVDEINAAFGETVLMLDCIGLKNGVLILRNYLTHEQILPLIRGTVVEGYPLIPDDRMVLREQLLLEAAAVQPDEATLKRPGALPVDHAFPVKGVGTVVLGGVVRGCLKRHETVKVLPTGKAALIRSIQLHDDDAEEVGPGERAGLALKGVEGDELDRGYVLSADSALTSSTTIAGRAHLVKYWPAPLREGMVLAIGHWMQFLPARVAYVDNAGDWHRPLLTIRTEKELVAFPGAKALLHYLEGGKLRVVGSIILT
ncbi:MAG: EF-Tu/IF-2/RF-3 family GTPase [Methanomicrobiales archaeon]|nr:EF-Tu/IF-2/RF-3 family GTPase [Methanomicrobiales archaeon]